jgi:hypothetical protein
VFQPGALPHAVKCRNAAKGRIDRMAPHTLYSVSTVREWKIRNRRGGGDGCANAKSK